MPQNMKNRVRLRPRKKSKRVRKRGASAYEKRGTAVNVPEWDASKCVGCNQCAFVCSHATIRPFQLTADELAAAPAQTKSRDNKPANEYKFVMAVSPEEPC